ncbi:MAG: diguanylate cyclase, partial [Pleurocapsa sp. MO_192.B19]|nr:diguanylate cyclase [Pleurocapsa sp. MO_192.B19]
MNTTQIQNSQANILIVDDTPDNLDLLAAILQKRGYQTLCVENGTEAIEVAHSGWAELILLDIQMPEIDGYQVCAQLKAEAKTSDIPIIFISALNDFSDKKKAFKVGGVDYINKPFEIKEVVVRVANQIAIQSSKSKIIELNNQLEQKVKDRTAELEKSNQQLQGEIDRRQQAQDRLLTMALQDPITGFANRNSFISRLKKALKDTEKQPDYFFAVILLECDRFRTIKRTLSHLDSNQLLMAIAHALHSCLPESALLSRLEGEEFAIFLDNIHDVNDAIAIVQKIQQKLTQAFVIKRRQILVNANIGIVIGNKDYQDIDRLFNDADIAMQQAKELEGDRYQVFKPEMYIQLQKDMEFSKHEMALKQAIKRQEFINYY